jgi:hypothetical protein
VAEDSDSGNEKLVGSEQVLVGDQGGSPRSAPAQRTLGDFLGADWKVVAPARWDANGVCSGREVRGVLCQGGKLAGASSLRCAIGK